MLADANSVPAAAASQPTDKATNDASDSNSPPANPNTDANNADANQLVSGEASIVKEPATRNSHLETGSQKINALAVDALCTDILSTYVNKDGLVDYGTLRRKRLDLINVLSEFAGLDPNNYASWSHDDKLAFWINAHNMYMLKAIVDNYPIEPSRFKLFFYPANSIMMISDFWSKTDCRIMQENYSLEELENKILRSQFDDPRICLAVFYGSKGCAPLRREPYYGRDFDKQLDDQARIFLGSDKGMKIDRDNSIVYLSPIFQWYGKEFVIKYPPNKQFQDKTLVDGAILTYISKHLSDKDANWLLRKIFTVKYIRYDWALNEQP